MRVPALREHAQDIPLLVDHFIRTICAEYHIPAKRIEDEALAELQTMPWSGNIRELRNVIERLIILSEERITPPTSRPTADRGSEQHPDLQQEVPWLSCSANSAENQRPSYFRSRSSRCNS